MAKVIDLLALKCRANYFKVKVWDNENQVVEETKVLHQGELEKYFDYELYSFDVAPALAEEPTYFMGEEMRLMIRPVITLNVKAK